MCGRKTCVAKVLLQRAKPEIGCTCLGHLNPRITSVASYLDATARNADSRSMLTDYVMGKLPGSVQLAHTRNLQPDMAAAHAAGMAARAVVPRAAASCVKLNAYRKAHTAKMQWQLNRQQELPRCGDTTSLLLSFDFQALDCSKLSQAQFVAWQVKQAWGLVEAGASKE